MARAQPDGNRGRRRIHLRGRGGSEIRKYTVDGALIASWPITTGEIFPGGRDLAVDPANNVYVVQNWGAVRKFSPTGADFGQPRGVGVACTDAYVANRSKDEVVRVHPSGPAGLCVTGTVPRVWIPPIVVDPTTSAKPSAQHLVRRPRDWPQHGSPSQSR